jgi:hypothetical protein
MRVRHDQEPGRELLIERLVTPHGCTLRFCWKGGVPILSVDLTTEDMTQFLMDSAKSLQNELRYWRDLLNAKATLFQEWTKLSHLEREPEPPL